MMTHQEINQRLPDYVLGLLTPGQSDEVADHLAGCSECRQLVLSEREIGALVRSTLNVTTRPDTARLQRLMPPLPQQPRWGKISTNWANRLAPALVVLSIIVGSFLIAAPESKRPMSFFIGATATATSTNTPTATIAQETSSQSADAPAVLQRSANGIINSAAGSPAPVYGAPAPLQSPTPAAAGSQMAAN